MTLPTIVCKGAWLAQAIPAPLAPRPPAFQVPVWAALLLLIGLLCGAYFLWKFLHDD
jgi:hypothetical protein